MHSAASDTYTVNKGDTLSSIAKATGKTVSDLVRLNDIKNRNKIEIGQTLYLTEQKSFAAQTLFLDALRHPIENLKYLLVFDGKTISGKTGKNGLTSEIVTRQAKSSIEIQILNQYEQWERLGSALSGYGKKLITLVSPAISFKEKLEPHPPDAPIVPEARQKPLQATQGGQPPLPTASKGESSKNNPALKVNKTKGSGGESVLQIGVDLPQDLLAYMQAYEDRKITGKEWKDYADYLKCEINVLKAIAKVESGGNSAFWPINDKSLIKATAPKIVFERHYFHRLTSGKYDQTNPDISWKVGYQRRKNNPVGSAHAKLHDNQVDQDDLYDNKQDYLRLINAYRLDKVAALKSASWGKFQIMGANHEICDEPDIYEFVAKMCKNEAGQIELLAGFIRYKPQAWKDSQNKSLGKEISLWDAVKAKNWQAIAFNYNGPKYKEGKYDEQLKAAYEEYCKKPA